MEENNEENKKEKKESQISSLIKNATGTKYIIHYSENNWETSEEIHIFLDDDATIGELLDESIKNLKRSFIMMILIRKILMLDFLKRRKKFQTMNFLFVMLIQK